MNTQVKQRIEKIWKQAYGAKTRDDLLKLYADWAGTYDEDHDAIGFFGHTRAAEQVSKNVPCPETAAILDAGAGTGAAGQALWKMGYRAITGLDLSTDMLKVAEEKGVYQQLFQADLGLPLDMFQEDRFDAAVMVGVFSYGQAPAEALDEMVRVVKPGGVIVFTMRTDFYDEDAMGVRSKMGELEKSGALEVVDVTEPELYLPKKDPKAQFQVWNMRVLETKYDDGNDKFVREVEQALRSPAPTKDIDHAHIWDSMGSRLYERYIRTKAYYLNDCEEAILETYAEDILNGENMVVELGCGSATKISYILDAAGRRKENKKLTYVPIDLSKGALRQTVKDVKKKFSDQITVEPRHGRFEEMLGDIPRGAGKMIFFFGSSVGNIERIEDTVELLAGLRERMSHLDRLVVGMDLDKSESVLQQAYQAGEENRTFFVHLVRRINRVFQGTLDPNLFEQDTSYHKDDPYKGIQNKYVRFRLRNSRDQIAYFRRNGMQLHLREGDGIQVGISRKFRLQDIKKLAALAGLQLSRQWVDEKKFYSLNEFSRIRESNSGNGNGSNA